MELNDAAARMTFSPVPLPAGKSGGYELAAVDEALRAWATSEPVRVLACASGWDWPAEGDTLTLLERLADLSDDWNFRQDRERDSIEGAPAEVNGREIPDALVIAAARALGQVDAVAVSGRRFSHLVVLSGLVSACVNRTHRAVELIRSGLVTDAVVVLSAHRALGAKELRQATEAGLGELADEAEVTVAATQRAFGLGTPVAAHESQPPASREDRAAFRAAWAHYQWPSAEVIIAPSAEPAIRRANTADQLSYWAAAAGVGSGHDVLILTTQIYVPYQHMEAMRVLGLNRGCGVYSCGVDAAHALLPRTPPFGGRDYLQEVRSALRAALELLRAAQEGAREER